MHYMEISISKMWFLTFKDQFRRCSSTAVCVRRKVYETITRCKTYNCSKQHKAIRNKSKRRCNTCIRNNTRQDEPNINEGVKHVFKTTQVCDVI